MVEICTAGVDTGFVALGYTNVAVLGVVQGITELLPISSNRPHACGWQDPGSAFSAAMQLAALAAILSLHLESTSPDPQSWRRKVRPEAGLGAGRPNRQLFLPVNLAAESQCPHIISIELRPNDLASPRFLAPD
jgi:hypothetical protein